MLALCICRALNGGILVTHLMNFVYIYTFKGCGFFIHTLGNTVRTDPPGELL